MGLQSMKRTFGDDEIVLTRAVVRACDQLGISQKVMASVLGVSEPTVSRMRDGSFILGRRRGKAFELAQLLLRIYGNLGLIVHGDEAAARDWLSAENTALGARPIDLIQTAKGLVDVEGYLRSSL
jgi:uncharacterized protein (DUF2384 family)